MTKYPLHNETHEVHPKGANIKKCPFCQGSDNLPIISSDFKEVCISIENKELIIKFLDDEGKSYRIVTAIDKCPKCGRKL
jgi:hypothetical protein